MDTLRQIGLSNAVSATALALLVATIARFCRRPALVHGMWLLVLVKLVTPSLLVVPMADYGLRIANFQASELVDESAIRNPHSVVAAAFAWLAGWWNRKGKGFPPPDDWSAT